MYDIVALGELLIDFTAMGADENGYPSLQAHPGGAPANLLAAAGKLGAKTALLSKVGEDSFGRLLVQTLERNGVETRGILRDEGVFTTLAFVTLQEGGEREFSFARKPGADTCLRFEELELSLVEGCKILHFGSLSLTDEPARSATKKAVEYAKSLGKLISYDPNYRPPLWPGERGAREQMLWGLSQADIVKLSGEEGEFLLGLPPKAAAKRLVERFGVKLAFVTCGEDGCVFATASVSGHAAALRNLPILDTTGAGDIFFGTALWKLLQIEKEPQALTAGELKEITSFACRAASLSATRKGGMESAPSREELELTPE